MANNCSCGGRLGATGQDNCVIGFKTTHNYILMPTYKADGTRNSIDLSSPTLGADILALTSATTPMDQRLYPLPLAENITREKSDRIIETAPSGNIYNVQDGLRSNTMEFFGASGSFQFVKELEKFGCTELSYFSVDVNGTLEGVVEDSDLTKMYPMPVMSNTYYAMYMYATDTTTNKVSLSFNLQRNFDETTIYYLTKADLGFNATTLKGLIPATAVVSNITTTGITVKIGKNTSSAIGFKPLVGLVPTDFSLYNNTGLAPVIVGSTEVSDGVYNVTYSDVVDANSFTLTAVQSGYDIAPVTYADPA